MCRLCLGGGLPSLSAYLVWGRCGLRAWALVRLGSDREPAPCSCGPCGIRWALGFCLPGAVLLLSSFWWGCVVSVSGVGSFPCWRACAGGGICSGVLVLGSLWSMLALAMSSAGDVLARCGFSVFVLWAVGVSFLFGPGLPIFLVSFPLGPDLGPDGGAAVPLI